MTPLILIGLDRRSNGGVALEVRLLLSFSLPSSPSPKAHIARAFRVLKSSRASCKSSLEAAMSIGYSA